MDAVTRNKLTEFTGLVAELNSLRLSKLLGRSTISVQHHGDWEQAKIIDFDEEDCRSFLLSCRLLVQDNDRISLRCVGTIVEESDCSQALKQLVASERFRMNLSLDDWCPLAAHGGARATNRDIFETFLWGAYAHRGMDPDKRERFIVWQSDTRQFLSLKIVFLLMLKIMLQTASTISAAMGAELEARSA